MISTESRFYPCSGREAVAEEGSSNNVINIELSPVGASPWEARSRARLTAAQKEENCRIASEEFRSLLMLIWLRWSFSKPIELIKNTFRVESIFNFGWKRMNMRKLLCNMLCVSLLCCRMKVSSQLMPQLSAFEPDLIFISAGFDGHCDDLYHFLTEADLHWVTQQLCQVGLCAETTGIIEY